MSPSQGWPGGRPKDLPLPRRDSLRFLSCPHRDHGADADMKADDLREAYLAFFESKGCVRRPSDVLVPRWDPSVLFTPAGMNQFKDH